LRIFLASADAATSTGLSSNAEGLGKLKLASAGMTYGERTARRAHEFIERATTKLEKRIELGYQA